MCKLALMPYLDPSKSDLAWQFARAITKPMCASDRDGFGYAAVDTNGRIGVERWITGATAWQYSARAMPPSLSSILATSSETPAVIRDHNGPHMRGKEVTALLLHSRMATSAVGLANNHPHVSFRGESIRTALVHNGVVQVDAKRLRYSTCDSETILTGYDKHGVSVDATAWQEAAEELTGYYALGIAHATNGRTMVDVIRDSSASLSVCWVSELNAPVIATAPEHVKSTCKRLGWHSPIVVGFKANTLARFDPIARTLVYTGQFKASERWTSYMWDADRRWQGTTYNDKAGLDETSPHRGVVYLDKEQGEVQDVLAMMQANERGARGKR